ncbi:MAG TPA: sigma 54-interacting transcriptional regulator, partial [Terriglobales bacterium]|nr:sigma 54-interacting transcriptional regulator [Terriglobales bacterium]
VARAIHRNSPRAGKPFVAINCATIPEGLLESELFGYERGALTGAVGQKKGRLEMADGGVVFLDEIANWRRPCKSSCYGFCRSARPISVDIRLIAASNKELAGAVANRTFRPGSLLPAERGLCSASSAA